MSFLDEIEFASRERLWTRHDAGHLKKYFEIKEKAAEAQEEQEDSPRKFLKHKRLLDEVDSLQKQGFSWTTQDEEILQRGDPTFEMPPRMEQITRELVELAKPVDEIVIKRRKAAKWAAGIIIDREAYLAQFPYQTNMRVAQEYNGHLLEDPIAKEAPDCIYGLRAWHDTQFYDVQSRDERTGSWVARRPFGTFLISKPISDKDAINAIRAGLAIPVFGFEGAYRKEGGIAIVTRYFKGKTLHGWTTGADIVKVPPWVWGKTFVELCGVADSLFSLGFKVNMDRFSVSILHNGYLSLGCLLHTVKQITGPTDKSMIKDLGSLFHWAFFKLEPIFTGTSTPRLKFPRGGVPAEIKDFLLKTLTPQEELCHSHPICSTSFVWKYMEGSLFQPPPLSSDDPKLLEKPKTTTEKQLTRKKLTINVPAEHTDNNFYKSHHLISTILAHFERASPEIIARPLELVFTRKNGVGSVVTDSFILEAWKGFFEMHSIWACGPNGFYIADGKQPCYGCGMPPDHAPRCSFSDNTGNYAAIGKWIANTLLRPSETVVVPLPMDPLFLKVVTRNLGLLDGMSPTEASHEYERIVEGREHLLENIQRGLFTATEMAPLAHVPVSLLMSWLFHTEPLDRATLGASLLVTQEGEDQRCIAWFMDWFRDCSEIDLRWFFAETLGSTAPGPGLSINITLKGKRDYTNADICQKHFFIPAVDDKELFYAMLSFKGPYFFNK